MSDSRDTLGHFASHGGVTGNTEAITNYDRVCKERDTFEKKWYQSNKELAELSKERDELRDKLYHSTRRVSELEYKVERLKREIEIRQENRASNVGQKNE